MASDDVVARTYVELFPKLKAFRDDLKKEIDQLNKQISQQVDKISQNVEKQSRGIGRGIAAGIATAGKLVAGATVAIGGAAAAMGIKTAASLEQAQIAFGQLLGGAKEAQQFIGQLSSFAAKTPFEMPGLINAARQLIGAGAAAKSVIPTLTAWGDATGALGLGQEQFEGIMVAVTQAMNKGKLQAEELMQITERGIPIYPLLAKALGKSVPEIQSMASEGKLLTKDVLPKLEAQMAKDYGGSMAKQSQTLEGLWSTLMDTINMGLAQTLQPLIPALKTGVAGAIEFLGGAMSRLQTGFKFVLDQVNQFKAGLQGKGPIAGFSGAVNTLGLGLRALGQAFKDPDVTSDGFVGVMERIGSTLRRVWDAMQQVAKVAGPQLAATFRDLWTFVQESAVPAAANLIAFLKPMLPTIIQLAKWVGTVLLAAFRAVGVIMKDVVGPALVAITKFMKDHRTLVMSVVVTIGTFVGIMKLAALATKAWGAATLLASNIMKIVKAVTVGFRIAVFALNMVLRANPIGLIVTAIGALVAGLIYAYKNSESFRRIVDAVWAAIKKAVKVTIDWIVNVAWPALKKAWQAIVDAAKAVGRAFVALWNGIVSVVDAIVGIVKKIVTFWVNMYKAVFNAVMAVVNFVKKWWPVIITLLLGPLGFAIAMIHKHWEKIKSTFFAAVAAIRNFFSNAITWLVNAGRNIVQGLWNGVQAVWSWFQKNVLGFINRVVIQPYARAITWLVSAGRRIITGLWNGVLAVWSWFRTNVLGFIKRNVIDPYARAVTWLYNAGRNVIIGIVNGVTSVAKWFRDKIAGVKKWITDRFTKANEWLYNTGKNLLTGLKNGLTNALGKAKDWFASVGKKIIAGVKEFFGIKSPSTVFAGFGRQMIRGLINGMISSNPASIAKKVFGSMNNALKKMVDKSFIALGDLSEKAMNALFPIGTFGRGTKPNANMQIAQAMLGRFGWGGGQWAPLRELWRGESGWRTTAKNPTSGAYGIPQALPASKMASAGADWRTNPATQIKWGLGYIKSRYGSPMRAYAAWRSRSPHWYGEGGSITEPIAGIGMRTGRSYGFGERGRREYVVPDYAGMRAVAGGGAAAGASVVVQTGALQITIAGNADANDVVSAGNRLIHELSAMLGAKVGSR